MKRSLSSQVLKTGLLCLALTAALVLSLPGCGRQSGDPAAPGSSSASTSQAAPTVLGEGAVQFALSVIDGEGTETQFTIHTDQETVGGALQALDLIEGEESAYGLFIKTVNGVTADYDKDGAYWAFYIDGEYALSGVDQTEIDPDSAYCLKVERA